MPLAHRDEPLPLWVDSVQKQSSTYFLGEVEEEVSSYGEDQFEEHVSLTEIEPHLL